MIARSLAPMPMPSGGVTSQEILAGYFVVAVSALCIYEHFITVGQELKHVWRRRVSGGSLLFILNRYAVLVSVLGSTAQDTPTRAFLVWAFNTELDSYSMICQVATRLTDISNMLIYISYVAFAALRMYALYGMKKTILILIFSLGILSPCVRIFIMSVEYTKTTDHSSFNSPDGIRWASTHCSCGPQASSLLGSSYIVWLESVLLALRVHALVFEAILVALTWNKTLVWRSIRSATTRTPMTTVLLRDGTLYFIAIAVANIPNLLGMVIPNSEKGGILLWLLLMSPFVDAITSICMSRFLLHLPAAAKGEYNSQYYPSRFSTVLRFAQLQTLGGQLRDTSDDDRDDESFGVDTVRIDEVELDDMRSSSGDR